MSLRADDGNLQVPSSDRHQRHSGDYEFLVVPRSMFVADGNMLHRSAKKLPSDRSVPVG